MKTDVSYEIQSIVRAVYSDWIVVFFCITKSFAKYWKCCNGRQIISIMQSSDKWFDWCLTHIQNSWKSINDVENEIEDIVFRSCYCSCLQWIRQYSKWNENEGVFVIYRWFVFFILLCKSGLKRLLIHLILMRLIFFLNFVWSFLFSYLSLNKRR